MKPYKFRWSRVYESTEEELTALLTAKGVTAERWVAEEFHDFGEQLFDDDTTIYCAEGSLSFEIMGSTYAMQPGDGLKIPGNLSFTAKAGFSGCVCYEATNTIE